MISLIVAIDENRAIGKDGDLLCYLPADLKHFKNITTGHTVVMGRKTFDSLPKGALPNRVNIVISRSERNYPDTIYASSLEEALEKAPKDREVFIIGGASIYNVAIDFADRIYLTKIKNSFADADTFFPAWDEAEWNVIEKTCNKADEKNSFDYDFITLDRMK